MTLLDTPAPEAIPESVVDAFTALTGQQRMPPLYRQIGNSPGALAAYLGAEQVLKDGVLSTLDIETVKLVVSGHNRCAFCLKTHRAKAEAAGLAPDDIEAALAGGAMSDARLEAIRVACVQLLCGTELGTVERRALDDAGIDQAGLVELALAMATIGFTNWFNHINHTPA
ncbi:MAG: carboxymuconolactone decarboxylase family protein [Pseudomonadota bacterium]